MSDSKYNPPEQSPSAESSTSGTPADSLQEALRSLSMEAAVGALEFSHRVKRLSDQFDGTALSVGASSGISDRAHKAPGEVIYEAVKLHLQIASELMTFGQKQADFVLDRVQRMGVSMLPKEQRPAVRLNCERTATDPSAPTWKLFVFNAAHEPRAVSLVGRWREGEKPEWSGENDLIVPPRTQRAVEVTHPLTEALKAPGLHVAEVEVFMQSAGVSATPGLSVGRLELALIVRS